MQACGSVLKRLSPVCINSSDDYVRSGSRRSCTLLEEKSVRTHESNNRNRGRHEAMWRETCLCCAWAVRLLGEHRQPSHCQCVVSNPITCMFFLAHHTSLIFLFSLQCAGYASFAFVQNTTSIETLHKYSHLQLRSAQ
jgi:hypothetical protein